MQRYFIDPSQWSLTQVEITGDDVHHIVNVMRSAVGEEIIVSDGAGKAALARLAVIEPKRVVADIVEPLASESELPVRVTIAQGLPKGDKMEWILQKGTELGAFAFFPFSSERTIVKLDAKKEAKKLERWQKIAKEAAEQSHRAVLPEIYAPVSFEALLKASKNYSAAVIAYEKEEENGLRGVLTGLTPGDSLLVLIGPEGGFSEDEVSRAQAAGIRSVTCGPRILRTETASQYVLSAVSYQFEM
ncbi:16S rRNA (uracil(1498)-N(3))-methyltransferase [Brevibacillus fluminis]|uniref:Ribosomal RNA small subunit methyltransferase E n=1 Tax=Brevibacillus fluminis TaxID=511487 RepID=A0A3M8D317_9BACL|nr:16S rRNA (uracil(1498)-N(3))-methyltransferase [Brevibacillus fluminis]RNB82303.1 16S rRNA (uracil(1498)-N(3))-methyltransferase [Brevibacillus fluminis]